MTKKVYVSSAQKAAAKVMVERRDRTGRSVSDAARKIAGAKKADSFGDRASTKASR